MEYYAAELELNAKFNTFAQNCSKVHVGHNTVQQQMKQKSKSNAKRGKAFDMIMVVVERCSKDFKRAGRTKNGTGRS